MSLNGLGVTFRSTQSGIPEPTKRGSSVRTVDDKKQVPSTKSHCSLRLMVVVDNVIFPGLQP